MEGRTQKVYLSDTRTEARAESNALLWLRNMDQHLKERYNGFFHEQCDRRS